MNKKNETPRLDHSTKELFDKAAKQMSRAAALIKEGEALKKSAKDQILPLMLSFGIDSSVTEKVGTVSARSGGGSSINKNLLTETLLAEGLDAARIPEIIKASTKSWTYDYLEFKDWKDPKSEE